MLFNLNFNDSNFIVACEAESLCAYGLLLPVARNRTSLKNGRISKLCFLTSQVHFSSLLIVTLAGVKQEIYSHSFMRLVLSHLPSLY